MNKTAAMTEERPIGGTCVNRGCLPSENLIAAAKLLARGYEPEVGKSIAETFAEEGIQVVLDATAQAVRRDGPEVVTTAIVAGRERQYRTERLLVAISRFKNPERLSCCVD